MQQISAGLRSYFTPVSLSALPGGRTVNTEPLPGSLATVTSPSIIRAGLRLAHLFDYLVGAGEQHRGTSRPSARAVLRLMTSSYLVGACTGRSAGFSPFRIRST